MNTTIEVGGLFFNLVGVFNGKPLYETQLPYDSHFYYVKRISTRRYDIERTDSHCENEEFLDEASTFEDAARIILEYFEEPW